jgi:outer membrane protein assembly factor BamB
LTVKTLVRLIPVLVAVVGALALALWLRADPVKDLPMRLEVAGNRPADDFDTKFPGEFLASGLEAPKDLPGMWPNFRGENYDAVSPDETPLARTWPADGPKHLWQTPVGSGCAGAAILNGRVFLTDYDEAKQSDVVRCLSLADGRELWRRWYEVPIESTDGGITRTVPAVTNRVLVSLGPKLHVMALSTATGSFLWGIDMVKQYKTKVPNWNAGQCPLIDRDRLILAPAGDQVLMTAIDLDTGEPVWRTPNTHHWKMTHSSVIPMTFKETRMYLYVASGGITAVASEDGEGFKAGDVLWQRDDWTVPFANVPSPVVLGGGHILLSGGFGGGSMLLKLKQEGGKFSTDILWRFEGSKEFAAEQQTPVAFKGYLYTILPKDAGTLAEQLVCVDSSGKRAWESGPKNRFGLGPYLIADGLLFVMSEKGQLTIAEAAADGYKPLATAKIFDAVDAWGPMAIAGGRLIVRDQTRMVCLDVRKPQ